MLPKDKSDLLRDIFINDYSENDLAKKLNVSRQAINKSKRKSLNLLKKYLENQ